MLLYIIKYEPEKLPIIKYFSKKSIFFVKYLTCKINLPATNRTKAKFRPKTETLHFLQLEQ